MALNRNTTFEGVRYEDTRVGSNVKAPPVDTVVGDDARTFQQITNLDAADAVSASPDLDGHTHLLHRALMSHAWGASDDCDASYSAPMRVKSAVGTSAKSSQTLFGFPVYIEPGWADHDLEFLMTAEGVLGRLQGQAGVTISVFDSSMAAVVDFSPLPMADIDGIDNDTKVLFGGTFSVPSGGVYVLLASIDIVAEPQDRFFYSINMVPTYRYADRDAPHPINPALNALALNPSVTSGWFPMDSALTAADFPGGINLMLAQKNQNQMWQLLTGLPAVGNTDPDVDGHQHDGADSKALAFNLCSTPFGSVQTSANEGDITGNGSAAPYVTATSSTSSRTVSDVFIQMPNHTLTTGGTTSKLKAAVLFHCEATGIGKAIAEIISTTGNGLAHSSIFTQTATGFQCITVATGTTSFDFTSGALEEFIVLLRATVLSATARPRIVGVCFYFEA